jgi:hypothetical protein
MNKRFWNIIIELIAVFFIMFALVMIVHAGGVNDDNDGSIGQILVSTGKNQGNSTGHWTSLCNIPELKGDQGEQGIAGNDGLNGTDGVNGVGKDGINGIDGYTPVKGVDYFDGSDGANGTDGLNGPAGANGVNGTDGIGRDGVAGNNGSDGSAGANGTDGKTPIKNVDYFDGLNGINGTNGKDVDPKIVNSLNVKNNEQDNRINSVEKQVKGLSQTQYNIRTELKFIRQKHLEMGVYGVYNTNRQVCSEVGINIVVPMGEGYQDRENKQTNKRLSNIEKILGEATLIEKVVDKSGNVISISIGTLKIDKSF